MATTEIRLQRLNNDYQSVRNAQDAVFDKVDNFEAALLGLTDAVSDNRARIDELHRKVDAIIEHLDVPYKPPMGFTKE